jgi:predicted nucleic acid-binding protein
MEFLLALDVVLVSHKVREFSRIAALRIEDWVAAKA